MEYLLHKINVILNIVENIDIKERMMKRLKELKAFTLAETMIVLAVLGVIAAIVVPSLVNKNVQSQNRTKIKKAMSLYERAINSMAIENDKKNLDELKSWANDGVACANSSKYFKNIEVIDGNSCTFRTSDGLYWDITDLGHPIIALDKTNFEEDAADDKDNLKAFYMVTSFDSNGAKAFRTNDLAYETGTNKTDLEKLYGFIADAKAGGENEQNSDSQKCDKSNLSCLSRYEEMDICEHCAPWFEDMSGCTGDCVSYRPEDEGGYIFLDNSGNSYVHVYGPDDYDVRITEGNAYFMSPYCQKNGKCDTAMCEGPSDECVLLLNSKIENCNARPDGNGSGASCSNWEIHK